MNIKSEKDRILGIYDASSSKGLYIKANMLNKIVIFILPMVLPFISVGLFFIGKLNSKILNIISLILLCLSFAGSSIGYDLYRKKEWKIEKITKDTHYNIFKKNLRLRKIKQHEIKYFIALLELDNEIAASNNYRIGFMGYISLFLVPALMIYFNAEFTKPETIVYLGFGLIFIPTAIFFIKSIFFLKE